MSDEWSVQELSEDKEIADWRERIEEIDRRLFDLLGQRFFWSREIGQRKRANGWSVEDTQQERLVVQRARQAAVTGSFNADFAEGLIRRIMAESKNTQKSILLP